MRALFWLLALAALGVAVALAAQFNDGNVALLVPPYRIDLSLNLFLLLLALLLLGAYALGRLAQKLAEFPRRVGGYRQQRGVLGSLQALREAVVSMFEGRYVRVERAAGAAQDSSQAALAALLAARAAHRMQEYERRDDWLRRAEADRSLTAARLIASAEMWNESHDVVRAQAAIAELHKAGGGRTIHASRIALGVNAQARRWEDVLKGVRLLGKRHALHEIAAQRYALAAYRGRLHDRSGDADELVAECRRIPAAELRKPELAADAARLLAAVGRGEVAAELIEAALQQEWDAGLVDLYGRVDAPPYRARIERASQWLQAHPDDPALLRALGLLCERELLWGKARGFLEQSAAREASAETSLALARVAEAIGDESAARRHYRDAALAFAAQREAARS